MYRILIPLVMVVLVSGCAMPGLFGQQAEQPLVTDTAQTVVVREIYHETPVVYVDTVYMAAEPEPVQPVYVENEYNEYNKTVVYVHEQVVVPPPLREPVRSPQHRDQRPRDRSGYVKPPERRDQPNVPVPRPPKKTHLPVTNDYQQAPTVPARPTPPSRLAPVRVRSLPADSMKQEGPKQAPIPSLDRPSAAASNPVAAPIGVAQVTRK